MTHCQPTISAVMTDQPGATPVAARRTNAGLTREEPRALSGANVTPLRTDEIQELRKELQEALAENESMAKDIDELYNNMKACGKGIIKRKRGGRECLRTTTSTGRSTRL